MLGRPLEEEECVHHIDHNKLNNSEDNLMVFATNADHTAFHYGGVAILQDNGSYKTSSKYIDDDSGYKKMKCPICKVNLIHTTSNVCRECYIKNITSYIPERTILKKLIRNNSFVKIGKEYNVTDNAIRKWCKKYNLPFRMSDIKKIF